MELFTNPVAGLFAIASLIVTVFCFSYVVEKVFDRSYPWYVNLIGGVLCAPFIWIPALVCFTLDVLGAKFPLIK